MKRKQTKEIILASGSKQRRRLLAMAGFCFSVRKSKVKEKKKVTTTCASLVKQNALVKAQDVARQINKGIVIGADTVVFLGKKHIIGKPRTLKEAKKTLRILSHTPHWIYTGLAVVDAKTKKTIVDYEKTKVHMRPLSDREIDQYYKLISPFDKAGGFDIEGKGSLFIERIEGCFFNVVGLPVAKLCVMLKKIGVHILSLLMIVNFLGCATEYNLATQKEEIYFYSTEKEIKIGENIAKQFDENYEISNDVQLNQKVTEIGRRLTEVCDRKELVYIFKVVDDEKIINATSLPGGFIYIFKRLVEEVEDDDQLAAVMAHEIGHITTRHGIKRLQGLHGYTFLKLIAIQAHSAAFSKGIDAAFVSAFSAYSLEDELEADRLGVKYLKKAGFDPDAMAGFLKRLRVIREKESTRTYSYWRTHPFISQRIATSNQAASGRMEFRDYINLMGEE